jgi:membrane-associated protein
MHLFDLENLILTIGYVGVFGIIFAESGLLFGFFFPGDSLLFTAGFLASQGYFDIKLLVLGSVIAAITGDSVGYAFGKRVGRALFKRKESFLFHKKNLVRAEEFYEKHGGKTIILARFMPFVRTFAPIVAGIGKMHYSRFLSFNVIGGFLWAFGVPFAGFWLGSIIPGVDKYLIPIIGLIIILSVAPSAIHILKDKENRNNLYASISTVLHRVVEKLWV